MRTHGTAGLIGMAVEIAPFTAAAHLPDVLRLCEAEGWPSLPSDPARAARALSEPGAVTVVAVVDGALVGFAFAFADVPRGSAAGPAQFEGG